MNSVAVVVAIVAGLFALWSVTVFVFALGWAMKKLHAATADADQASIMFWGVISSLAFLVVLFGLVRFVRFAWQF